MKSSLTPVSYAKWPNCLRLSDGETELIVTTDVGPRIIRCGRVGGPNLFKEYARQMGRTGGSRWRIFGGHRFWIAPEHRPLTYVPDNIPVPWTWNGSELRITQQPDQPSGLQKHLAIRLAGGAVCVTHTLVNRSKRTQRVAPWSLTVMAPGGRAIFPQARYASHTRNLLPARPVVLWKYTNMADPRWTWGEQLIQLRQDPKAKNPQKVGLCSTPAWMAYATPHATFIKRHTYDSRATYADMGCNAETFTNADMLELESLGALVDLKPGARATHVETWRVFGTVLKDFNEKSLAKALHPLVLATPRPR